MFKGWAKEEIRTLLSSSLHRFIHFLNKSKKSLNQFQNSGWTLWSSPGFIKLTLLEGRLLVMRNGWIFYNPAFWKSHKNTLGAWFNIHKIILHNCTCFQFCPLLLLSQSHFLSCFWHERLEWRWYLHACRGEEEHVLYPFKNRHLTLETCCFCCPTHFLLNPCLLKRLWSVSSPPNFCQILLLWLYDTQ